MEPHIVTGLPGSLTQLAAEIHADNIRAGWWKTRKVLWGLRGSVTVPRNIGELLCLVHSEISEADAGFSDALPDDKLPHRDMIEVELADTAIRVLDILGFHKVDVDGAMLPPAAISRTQPWQMRVREMHRLVSTAMERFRKGDTSGGTNWLIVLLWRIDAAALALELDLTGAIAEKRAFNAKRADHKPKNRAAAGGKKF